MSNWMFLILYILVMATVIILTIVGMIMLWMKEPNQTAREFVKHFLSEIKEIRNEWK